MSNVDKSKKEIKISKAQKALAASLLSLLHKHSFQKITVNDICETAMVSRASFYIHFEDKYHLLRFALEGISNKITFTSDPSNRQDLIGSVVDYVYENKKLFNNLLMKDTNPELTKMLSKMFVDDIADQLNKQERQRENDPIPIPVSILSVYIAGGIVHLFLWWIGGGFSITKEEMIEYLTILSTGKY